MNKNLGKQLKWSEAWLEVMFKAARESERWRLQPTLKILKKKEKKKSKKKYLNWKCCPHNWISRSGIKCHLLTLQEFRITPRCCKNDFTQGTVASARHTWATYTSTSAHTCLSPVHLLQPCQTPGILLCSKLRMENWQLSVKQTFGANVATARYGLPGVSAPSENKVKPELRDVSGSFFWGRE